MGKIIGEGITFDDVLLVPQFSQVIPNDVILTTQLTKKITLNIPLMSLIARVLIYQQKLPRLLTICSFLTYSCWWIMIHTTKKLIY